MEQVGLLVFPYRDNRWMEKDVVVLEKRTLVYADTAKSLQYTKNLAPENNIAADNKILPTGILLLTKGWLHQSLTCEQYEHFWLIWMHVPTVFFVTAVDFSPQLGHLLKSESRFSSKTMYFLHSCKGKSKSSVCSNCKI